MVQKQEKCVRECGRQKGISVKRNAGGQGNLSEYVIMSHDITSSGLKGDCLPSKGVLINDI